MRRSEGREDERRIPRDRVTGVPAHGDGRITDGTRSDEIEQEIRRTRARMGSTLDELEGRLAPARIKRQLKGAVNDTIAEVRHEYDPRRMAQQASETMLDTLKHHPFAALAAGLSIGYLAMKGAEESGSNGYDRETYGRSGYTGSEYGNTAYGRTDYGPRSRPYDEQYRERAGATSRVRGGTEEANERFRDSSSETGEAYRQKAEELRGRAEETGERIREETREAGEAYRHGAKELRERAEDATRETTRRARELTDTAERRTRSAARSAKRQARSTANRLEDFIYDNPLAAGAVALGVGALVGGMFPSTDIEDRYMGPARDEAYDRARRVADETIHEGKEAARRVGNEAREAASDVVEKSKKEAKNVGESAKETATQEAESAKSQQGGSQTQGVTGGNQQRPAGTSQRESSRIGPAKGDRKGEGPSSSATEREGSARTS